MSLTITAKVERWPVAGAFIIARGAKTHVDVVHCTVSDGTHSGHGEGTPVYYEGETAEGCVTAIETAAAAFVGMPVAMARMAIQLSMPRGAARNALDCALWDLESKATGMPLWRLVGLAEAPEPLTTAFTISLGEPHVMEDAARLGAAQGYGLLKLKLTGEGDRARVAAVRRGAPDARLIVDANESWAGMDFCAEAAALAAIGVEMIEQPLPHDGDLPLDGAICPLPFVADESCHTSADIAQCVGRYQGINIKLDKAGGLTEALLLRSAAEAAGLDVMVGCMLSTSLGIAPAFLVAQGARWVDLDGPALLAEDREEAFVFAGGRISQPG